MAIYCNTLKGNMQYGVAHIAASLLSVNIFPVKYLNEEHLSIFCPFKKLFYTDTAIPPPIECSRKNDWRQSQCSAALRSVSEIWSLY